MNETCTEHNVYHCLDCGYHWMSADELLKEVSDALVQSG